MPQSQLHFLYILPNNDVMTKYSYLHNTLVQPKYTTKQCRVKLGYILPTTGHVTSYYVVNKMLLNHRYNNKPLHTAIP